MKYYPIIVLTNPHVRTKEHRMGAPEFRALEPRSLPELRENWARNSGLRYTSNLRLDDRLCYTVRAEDGSVLTPEQENYLRACGVSEQPVKKALMQYVGALESATMLPPG